MNTYTHKRVSAVPTAAATPETVQGVNPLGDRPVAGSHRTIERNERAPFRRSARERLEDLLIPIVAGYNDIRGGLGSSSSNSSPVGQENIEPNPLREGQGGGELRIRGMAAVVNARDGSVKSESRRSTIVPLTSSNIVNVNRMS